MDNDSFIDLLQLMRRICVVPEAADLLPALTDLATLLDWHSYQGESTPERAVLSMLVSLAFEGSSLRLNPGRLDSHRRPGALKIFRHLEERLPELPERDPVFIAAIDDYLLGHVEHINQQALPLFLERLGVPDDLRLVSDVATEFGQGIDLSNFMLVAVQHLLGSSLPVFNWLNRLGLPYERMHIVGKVYSANRLVVWKLRTLGARVHPGSLKYRYGSAHGEKRSYEDELRAAAEDSLQKAFDDLLALPKSDRHLLILDDGGHAVEALTRLFPSYEQYALAVEQTRKGIAEIRRNGSRYKFPIVNVAESQAKLTLESPLIGESILEQTASRLLRIHNKDILPVTTVLVIGYGSVGSSVAKAFRKYGAKRIIVFDKDAEKRCKAIEDGFESATELVEGLAESNVVIGCTGTSCLPQGFEMYLQGGAVLASGSTSDIEFQRIHLRPENRIRWYKHLNANWESDHQRVHSDYKLDGARGEFWLLNAGFPINFDGSVDPILPRYIQLTRASMLAGVCQLMRRSEGLGLVELRSEYDDFVSNQFIRLRSQ